MALVTAALVHGPVKSLLPHRRQPAAPPHLVPQAMLERFRELDPRVGIPEGVHRVQ